jgi:uncharacterized membrane protein YdjX (TVP38/TMEM64 family)
MALTKRKAKRVAKRYWPLAVAGLVVLVAALAWIAAPASQWVELLGQKIAALGAWGPVIYVLTYVVGTLVLAPSPVMSIAAGAMFGWWGLPLCVLAATAGATASFIVSRYFFAETLDDWLKAQKTFGAVKHAVDEEGWKIVLPLRLSPVVPFGLLNYMLGLTRISWANYILCTAIGILPGSIVDVYIGVIGVDAANASNTAQLAYLVLGLIATIGVGLLITYKARAYLREEGVKV